MHDQKLQFRVGVFVIVAGILAVLIVIRFGELRWLWERHYRIAVLFEQAPNVQAGTPVRKSGVRIGAVRDVVFDEAGGVTVLVDIQEHQVLRKDSRPRLSLSLLGDATIEFSPGRSRERLAPGSRIVGVSPLDPLELVAGMEAKVSSALASFEETSAEWKKVGANVNSLVETNRGNLDLVIERTAESLASFTATMQNINSFVDDPKQQEAIAQAIQGLPTIIEDTRLAIGTIRSAVQNLDENLENLKGATEPLAKHSDTILVRMENSAGELETLLGELNIFAKQLSSEEGSLNQLIADPELYQNLNRSAGALHTVLTNLEPVAKDMRKLSDKLARHPELLGIRGAISPSNGLKESENIEQTSGMREAGPKRGLLNR